ncbi:unnamed protein product, partial [Heterotrigona itama]
RFHGGADTACLPRALPPFYPIAKSIRTVRTTRMDGRFARKGWRQRNEDRDIEIKKV